MSTSYPKVQLDYHRQMKMRIDGYVYKPQRWNDGDSFHVILPDQKVNHKNFDAEFP